MGVEEFEQPRNGLDPLQMLDDQGPEHGVAGMSVASDAVVAVGQG